MLGPTEFPVISLKISAKYLCRLLSISFAATLQTARETAKIALAPM